MDSTRSKDANERVAFLKVFATIFFPLLFIVTLVVAVFYKGEQQEFINQIYAEKFSTATLEPLIVLWLFLCGGVALCCYLMARAFMNYRQGKQELAQQHDHLEEMVEARTAELNIANRLLQSSEKRAHLVKKIASAANANDNTEEVLLVAIRSIARYMQWPIGHVQIISPDHTCEMVSTSMWYLEEPTAYEEFVNYTEKIRFGLGSGLPGRALLEKKAILIQDISKSTNFLRTAVAARSGINAGFALPVFVHGEVVAVLEFFAHKMDELDEDVLSFAEQIGEQLTFLMERKQGEETLRLEQEKAQQYLNIAGSVIVVIAEDSTINLVNKAGIQLLGYTEEELIGENWFDKVVHPQACMITKTIFNQIMMGKIKPVEFYEDLISLKDGTEKLMAWHNVLIYDKNARIIGILASGEDITEHRNADKELHKLSQAVEQSPVSVVITDRQGRIQYVNTKFCERTHYRPEEVMGQNPKILKSGSLPHSFYQELWQTILAGRIWRGDFLNKTKEGDQYWERASISSIMDAAGHITHFIAIKEDITEQKKMEEELLEAKVEAELSNKAKGDFLANMSHEIRTPMNAVIGLTHLALQTDLLPKQRDYLQKISVSAQSLMKIINDILDFSKFAAGKIVMENIQFNLWQVMEEVTTILYSTAEEKGLEMVLNVAQNVPMRLRGDPHRLKQILLNLLSNSLKFTEQGEVVLTVKLVKQVSNKVQLEFNLRDTGIGMNEQEKSRLFNAFTQADGSTTRKYGGTGLGLVISKQLVELMGGAMHVKSQPAQGSEFIFTANFGSYEEDEQQCFSHNIKNLKVLVIDDNESSLLACKEILEGLTCRVFLAISGEDGIEQLTLAHENEPFDLILMDWMMPSMDGFETAQQIRSHLTGPTIPIILVTSNSEEKIRKQADEMNLEGFLIKPVTPSILFNEIVGIFGKGRCQTAYPISGVVPAVEQWNHLRGARILLVEDNEINLQVAREIMEQKNMIVTVARNGWEAVQLVRSMDFDGVLMDIQMPEMGGLEATELIRQDYPLINLPIIAMTADVVPLRIQEYLATGMNDCIFKPIDIEQMFKTISKWVQPHSIIMDSVMQTGKSQETQQAGLVDVPPLQGINVESGLARVGGNKKLYHKLLLQFLENNEGTVAMLQVALKQGDYPRATMNLHTLKGVAGTIGADHLYAATRDLEKRIKEGQDEKIAQQMEYFSSSLLGVLHSIRGLEESVAESNSPQKGENRTDLSQSKALIETLQGYLANYDTEATAVFEKLKALPVSNHYQVEFKKIQMALNNYDFEKALEQLKEIGTSMGE